MGNLDRIVPQGNPTALYCRHCQAAKYRRNGALICRTCDGPIHLLKVRHVDE